jgi:hypothetical protein
MASVDEEVVDEPFEEDDKTRDDGLRSPKGEE